MPEKPVIKLLEVIELANKIDLNSSADESLQNATFKAIGEAHIINLIEDLEAQSEYVKKIRISQSMEDWSTSLTKEIKKKKMKNKFSSNKAAIFLLILLGAFSITTLSVEAQRHQLFEYFTEIKEEFMRIYRSDDIISLPDPKLDINHYFYPTVAPKGYSFHVYNKARDVITMTYSNGVDTFVFIQCETTGNYNLDSEDAEIIEIEIGENRGYLITKKNKTILFWHDDKNEFTIKGSISGDEAIKIAESLNRK